MPAIASQLTPKCTHCKAVQITPEWSEIANENEIVYFWRCTSCGHEFQTRDRLVGPQPSEEELVETFLPDLVVE